MNTAFFIKINMKMKLTLIFLITAVTSICVAQDVENSTFKPLDGDKTLELQLAPLSNNPLGITGIRGRLFMSDQTAFRLNTFVGYTNETIITQQKNDDTLPQLVELKDSDRLLTINIRPGFEKHLSGTDRLSPYFGGEVDLAYQRSVFVSEEQSADDIVTNTFINDNGFIRAGLNGIAGFDFYVAKHFYMGAELGFGLSYTKPLAPQFKSDLDGFEEPEPNKTGSSITFGPIVNTQIRIGYAF